MCNVNINHSTKHSDTEKCFLFFLLFSFLFLFYFTSIFDDMILYAIYNMIL